MVSLRGAALLNGCAIFLLLITSVVAWAQSPAIDELKGRIFDARTAQQSFPGFKYCKELDGKSFYFPLRNRVLNLEEYFRSLENLVKSQVFNPAKRRPWTLEDAKERWEEVKRQAQEDRGKCELVRRMPEMERKLKEMLAKGDATEGVATATSTKDQR